MNRSPQCAMGGLQLGMNQRESTVQSLKPRLSTGTMSNTLTDAALQRWEVIFFFYSSEGVSVSKTLFLSDCQMDWETDIRVWCK